MAKVKKTKAVEKGERRWRELQIQKRAARARGELPPPVWAQEKPAKKARPSKAAKKLHTVTIYATARWFLRCSRLMQGSADLSPLAGVFLEAVDHTGVVWQVTPDGVRRSKVRR